MNKLLQALLEADITDRIMRDPSRAKMMGLAYRHDKNMPVEVQARLGPKPTDAAVARAWSDLLDKMLTRTAYGDLSTDYKFADWLTKIYASGGADWEDVSGEGGDVLGAWHALSVRGLLNPAHQDLNRFGNIHQLQVAMRSQKYQDDLRRIKNAAEIDKMKRDAKDIVLVDNDRVWAAIPLNYGSCYTFNNAAGYQANFCTGGSSGASWFQNYAPRGPLIMVVDKDKLGTADGKWQMHAATDQLVNADQDRRYDRNWNDEKFAEQFPGLMRQMVQAMLARKDDIDAASQDVMGKAYDVTNAAGELKAKFPKSYASRAKHDTEEPTADDAALAAGMLPDSHYTVPEEYRQFLAPDFENKLNHNSTRYRNIRVYRNDGEHKTVNMDSAISTMRWIANQDPEWLQPGSITKIVKIKPQR